MDSLPPLTPPPVPPEAAPWPVSQALGRDAIAGAWEACFRTGVEVGKTSAWVDYAKGVAHAGIFSLSLFLLIFGVATLARGVRER